MLLVGAIEKDLTHRSRRGPKIRSDATKIASAAAGTTRSSATGTTAIGAAIAVTATNRVTAILTRPASTAISASSVKRMNDEEVRLARPT